MTKRIDQKWTGPALPIRDEIRCEMRTAVCVAVPSSSDTRVAYEAALTDAFGPFQHVWILSYALKNETATPEHAFIESYTIEQMFNEQKRFNCLGYHVYSRKPRWWPA